ncbi:MAG: hypothetical protein ACTS27_13130, partial [Phycisphaerales bacterium]
MAWVRDHRGRPFELGGPATSREDPEGQRIIKSSRRLGWSGWVVMLFGYYVPMGLGFFAVLGVQKIATNRDWPVWIDIGAFVAVVLGVIV